MKTRTKKSWLTLLAILIVSAAILSAGCGGGTKSSEKSSAMYHCPMHPTYVSDHPGDCPICHMKLVPIESRESSPATATATPGERRILLYRNPMNPAVTSPVPMKDEMGMDYVPVYADEATSSDAGSVEGYATVHATPEALNLAGIRMAVAETGTLARSVRAAGIVTADETRRHEVHTKVSGWVETLAVNFTGQFVRKGQPLLSIYSPELVATQDEYIRSRQVVTRFENSPLPEARSGAMDLLHAARERLLLFDVPASLFETLDRTGKTERTVTLEAPATGYVTAKNTLAGTRVEPGMALFEISDLSRVWIEASLYEYEAASVKEGLAAVITLPGDAGFRREARVAYVYPVLDAATRTLKVRFDLANPDMVLKPGMYANVALDLATGEGVLIPEDAILDSGLRKIVFVGTAAGTFEPREVKVGVRGDGRAQILEGVAAGEPVVIRANFLLDSESRLRAAISGTTSGTGSKAGGDHGGHP